MSDAVPDASYAEVSERTRRCGCGAVSFTARTPKTFGVCHCRTCRRWVGGVWMGVLCEELVNMSGPVETWISSRTADRGFCRRCGSSIWHRSKLMKQPALGLGLFDDQEGRQMVRQIFTNEPPRHYNFGSAVPGFTGWGTLWAFLCGRLPK